MRMINRLALAVIAMGMLVSRAEAGLVFYSDEAAFDAASPILSTQTFDAANVAPGGIAVTNSGLNSSTNDGVFSTGDILPGLSFTSTPNGGEEIAVTGTGFNGITNEAIFGNYFDSPLNVNFSDGVTSASANLISYASGSTITGTVFSTAGAILGTFSVPDVGSGGLGTFFGVIATGGDEIGQIAFSPGDLTVGLERVQFGTSVVPEPSSFAMCGIAGAVGMAVARFRRKRIG